LISGLDEAKDKWAEELFEVLYGDLIKAGVHDISDQMIVLKEHWVLYLVFIIEMSHREFGVGFVC